MRDGLLGKFSDELRLTGMPVKALELITENHSGNGKSCWKHDLERIALLLRCNWAADGEVRLPVVGGGRKNHRRSPTLLFVAGLWIKSQPDKMAAVWNVPSRLRCHASPR